LHQTENDLYYDALHKSIVAGSLLNHTLSVYKVDGRLILSHFINEDAELIYIVKAFDETLKMVIKD
jgi:hypothetical protein